MRTRAPDWPRAGRAVRFDNVVEVGQDIESTKSNLVIMSQAQRALSHVIKVLPRLAQGGGRDSWNGF